MEKRFKQYFLLGLILVLIYLLYIILKPYLITIATSMLLAFILYPLYKFVKKLIRLSYASSILTIIIFILIFVIPFIWLFFYAQPHIPALYSSTKELFASADICNSTAQGIFGPLKSKACETYHAVVDSSEGGVVPNLLKEFITFLMNAVKNVFISLPRLFIDISISLFIIFYLLVNGDAFVNYIKQNIPLDKKKSDYLFKRANYVMKGVIYGTILVSLVQAIVATIGYFVFKAPAPLLFGILTFFFSFIPFIGSSGAWLLVTLIFLVQGNYIFAVLMFLYGAFIVSTVDNFIKPFLIGGKAKVHPVLVLLGVLGGLSVFGLPGLILGPVIIALGIEVLSMKLL